MLCLVLGLFLYCFAGRESTESETEMRMLAGFPEFSAGTVFSGEFMTGFESYLSDQFFARNDVIDATDGLTSVFSRMTQEDQYVLDDTEKEVAALVGEEVEGGAETEEDGSVSADEGGEMEELEEEETDDGAETEDIDDSKDTSENKKYTLYLKKTDGTTRRVYLFPMKNILQIAETLNMYKAVLPEDGMVHFAQVPFAATAKRWLSQQDVYCGWGSSVETALQQNVSEGVVIHNTTAILEPHMAQGEVCYMVADHHWTPKGAYYVAAEMMRSQGFPVVPYDEYDYKVVRSSKSSHGEHDTLEILYPLAPVHSLIMKQRTADKELSLMNYKATTYVAFMNNSRRPWRKIVTGFHTGRKALIISDSFGNAFAPYLLPYYDEVHMTDIRKNYYKKDDAGGSVSELISYYGIDDVYIILSTANGMNSGTGLVYLRQYFLE
jgi:hypothetical protein